MSPTGNNSRTGFTLIEVLVALVILATGIVVVLRAFQTSAVALGEARDRMWATLLIGEKLSDIEAFVYDNPGLLPESSEGRFTGLYRDFLWRCEVGDPPRDVSSSVTAGDDGPAYLRISVRRDGNRREYLGETFLRALPSAEEAQP